MEFKRYFLIFLFITTGVFYYSITGHTIERQMFSVTRIIDGDTIEIETGQKIRFKGINTPEQSMPGYSQAKDFLRELIENKSVWLESYGADKYGRILAYVFTTETSINEQILRAGLATSYYYEKDTHYESMIKTESIAQKEELGVWAKSPKYGCLSFIELRYKEGPERCSNNEKLILENSCEAFNVIIKDDATHIYKEEIPKGIFEKSFSCIWNDEGDSLYVFDEEGLLIFYRY